MIAVAEWAGEVDGEEAPEAAWRAQEEDWRELPAARLAVCYMLLVPLLLFAVHGCFSFEYSERNSDLGAVGGKMAVVSSAAETVRDRVQTSLGLAFCLVAMAGFVRSATGAAQAMPLFVALPVYAMSSAAWSQDPGMSLRSAFSLSVTTLFAFYLAARFGERQRLELLMLLGGVAGMASVAMALGLPQFGLDHQLHEGAWQGLFTQKNVCAEAMLFLLTPALAFSPRGRYGQLLRGSYIALCLTIIAMTQSRTGWAMTALYLVFALCLRVLGRFERKDLLPIAAAAFGFAGAGVVAAIAYSSQLLPLIGRSGGLSGREQIWAAISASILRRPLGGYGFDAFWSQLHGEASRVFASAGWVVTSADNGFLNVALELGLIGLVLIFLTLVQACRNANAAFRPGRSPYVDWCIGIVFLTAVYNLDERTLMATQYLPWILYVMACAGLREAAFAPAKESGFALAEARA